MDAAIGAQNGAILYSAPPFYRDPNCAFSLRLSACVRRGWQWEAMGGCEVPRMGLVIVREVRHYFQGGSGFVGRQLLG
jgi:hypothetical protein